MRGIGAAIGRVHTRADAGAPMTERPSAPHRAIVQGLLDPDPARRRATARYAAAALDVDGDVGGLVDALTPAAELGDVVVHNDLHEAQVMVDGGGSVTGLVDWQTASIDHPFVDFDMLQWGRGALARFDPDPAPHRRAMWEGAGGDALVGAWAGELLHVVWTLTDGWWAASSPTAPVTGLTLGAELRTNLVSRAGESGEYEMSASSWSEATTFAPRQRAPSRTRRSLETATTVRSGGSLWASSRMRSSASTSGGVNSTSTGHRGGRVAPRPSVSAPSNTTRNSAGGPPVQADSASRSRARCASSGRSAQRCSVTL